jgi:alternate signal-mediated exported protein
MNKMIKGAAVAGLGVALLLGGGGTLAIWNDAADSQAGSIIAGDLDLVADDAGTWTSSLSGPISVIGNYRVIPGETLTYTQPLTVKLTGDELVANLVVTGAGQNNGFTPDNVAVSTTLTNTAGKVLPATEFRSGADQQVTASTSFDFLAKTDKRDSVNATYDFASVGFKLEQLPAN